MRLKWILAIASTIVILTILCLVGFFFLIFKFFLDMLVAIAFTFCIGAVGFFVGLKASSRVKKAEKEELRREDDVLLQAVGFSQSVIFILLSLSESTYKLTLICLVATTTVVFYALRAWAKIKNSAKYRYRSMNVFSFVCSNSVTSTINLLFSLPDRFYLIYLTSIYSGIAIGVLFIAQLVFSKRYDYKGFGFL